MVEILHWIKNTVHLFYDSLSSSECWKNDKIRMSALISGEMPV